MEEFIVLFSVGKVNIWKTKCCNVIHDRLYIVNVWRHCMDRTLYTGSIIIFVCEM